MFSSYCTATALVYSTAFIYFLLLTPLLFFTVSAILPLSVSLIPPLSSGVYLPPPAQAQAQPAQAQAQAQPPPLDDHPPDLLTGTGCVTLVTDVCKPVMLLTILFEKLSIPVTIEFAKFEPGRFGIEIDGALIPGVGETAAVGLVNPGE